MTTTEPVATIRLEVDATAVRTVPDLVAEAAERWPARPALIGTDRVWTYEDVRDEVSGMARWLRSQGIGNGDRVALWMSNRPEWVLMQFAVSWAGAILVPVNARLRRSDLASVVRRSGSRLLVIGADTVPVDTVAIAAEVVADLREEGYEDLARVAVIRGNVEDPDFTSVPDRLTAAGDGPPRLELDQPAYLMYTSGTTSAPKGVTLTFRSLGNAIKGTISTRAEDVIAMEYPLAAITGCHNSVLGAWYAGASLIIHDGTEAGATLRLAREHHATVYAGHRLALRDIASAVSDGDLHFRHGSVFPIDPSDEWAYRRLGIESIGGGYGMTETSGGVAVNHVLVADGLSPRASGYPAYEAQVRIIDSSGEDVPVGEQGEILVKGPQLMVGYWSDPETTSRAIDADGWLHTGDLGELADDGKLTFIERFVDTYKCLGFNVSPGEVEEVIKRLPEVEDCTVAGVPHEREGQSGVAFVILRPGASLTADTVREHSRAALASFKVPRDVVFLTDIPRTGTGKPQRRALVSEYVAAHTKAAS